jgi:anti-sigma B factor antagonist
VEIETIKSGQTAILRLEGHLDSISSNYLKESINRLFEDSIYNIVVDLKDVGFVDSAGLGQLVSALRMCTHQKGTVVLSGVNDSVIDLLRITRLDTVFRIYETSEEAAQSITPEQ